MISTRELGRNRGRRLAFIGSSIALRGFCIRMLGAERITVRTTAPVNIFGRHAALWKGHAALLPVPGHTQSDSRAQAPSSVPLWGVGTALLAAGLATAWLYRFLGERSSLQLLAETPPDLPNASERLLHLIERLLAAETYLSLEEAADAMHCMLEVVSENPARVAAFLVLLRRNGAETGEVLAGMAAALLERAVLVSTGDIDTLDIVGTGGDGANTVNISTAAAIVAAACGARVAKHGNRSASSQCGSADVLEALGVKLELEAASIARCIAETGIGFLMAPHFHPQLASLAPLRRSLRVRTVFNILGPLLNPARSRRQVIGVAVSEVMEPMAEAMRRLGTERTWIVHCSGLDEMAPIGPTEIIEVSANEPLRRFQVDPKELGMPLCTVQNLVGGDCAANAEILTRCLQGAPGPISNAIIMNAGAGLVVYGLAETLHDGCAMAAHALMSGAAWETLEKWKSLSQTLP
ncbi:hypothetical protein CCYA_CCYA12G3361 [Cyanidiococcus yangmingshanensis]|nr:hypothetical protein CCYA_CCYA12G3361 [Cyanidiococcus yangmingshanensis]